MFILSQNKERLYNLTGHIEGIGYEEIQEHSRGKKEDQIRHTLMVFDGYAEEVAEYETKEDCMIVLYAIYKAIEQDVKCAELPKKEEVAEQRELIKQFMAAGGQIASDAAKFLKDIFKEFNK